MPCQDIQSGIRKPTEAVQTCRRPNIGHDKVVAMIVGRRAPVSAHPTIAPDWPRKRWLKKGCEDFRRIVEGFAIGIVSANLETMREQMGTFNLQAVVVGARVVAADNVLTVSRIQLCPVSAVEVVELLVGEELRSDIPNVANGEEHIAGNCRSTPMLYW